VEWFVQWGLAHRKLEEVRSIGVDEIHWGKSKRADNFLTVILPDRHPLPPSVVGGQTRTQATLRRGLAALGTEVVQGLRFVCSDMWRPYLNVIGAQAAQALQILDRFHITSHLNQALDQVRRAECGQLRAAGSAAAERLKNMRWKLLRRHSRVRGGARRQLSRLLNSKLTTARAWALKDLFEHFWTYKSVRCAGEFLQYWTWRALRSRMEPMRKVARTLRAHEDLLMNWFKAKGEISSAVVEGLNNKIRVVTRRSYGFRTYDAMEIALYHTLGKLPEPGEFTHRFC
jgi:transposase